MATAEAETSQEEHGAPGGLVYDGFISYSHAADDLLAPRLQAGLQRFAKPWWKRRALKIFRDESSLSANPHLWSSITDALDTSDWFVLLLSPDAADSEWVNQEVEYWLEHKDSGRIIPVVTDGEFTWSETDIDLESTAVPPALYGAFSDEPRWVDLRFARTEEQLDLNNPRFSAAVADIASAIRRVPKDELESEEVLQHRRTVRTAWAAGAGLLILALIAGGAALFALDQRNDAVANAARADENATEAIEQSRLAEENADEANEQRQAAEAAAAEAEEAKQEAEQQAAIAQAREVTLEAEKLLETDPELSSHLAVAALTTLRDAGENSAQAESVLRAAIANDRITHRVPGGIFVAVHPDGSLLATRDGGGVAVWDIETGEVVERYGRAGVDASGVAFSPDGELLAVTFPEEPTVTVWSRRTGESFTIGSNPASFSASPVFGPNGELLAVETLAGIEVWSMSEQQLVYQSNAGDEGPDFNADGLMSYGVDDPSNEGDASSVHVVDPATGRLVRTFPIDTDLVHFAQWSPDGSRIAAGDQTSIVVLDAATGVELSRTGDVGRLFRPEWLPTGDAFFVGGEQAPRVIDATTGQIVMDLRGLAQGSWDYDLVPGTASVASASAFGSDTVIFDTSQLGGLEVGGWLAPINIYRAGFVGDGTRVIVSADSRDLTSTETIYVAADALDGGGARIVEGGPATWWPDMNANGTFIPSADPDGIWSIRATDNDEVIYRAPEGWSIHAVSWDGTQAVINSRAITDLVSGACGPTLVVSTVGGSSPVELDDVGCAFRASFSPDGDLVYIVIQGGEGVEGPFDTATGKQLAALWDHRCGGLAGAFTPDGSELFHGFGPMCVFDVATLISGGPVEDAVRLGIAAHDTLVLRVSVSPDGSQAVSASWTEPLKLWDLEIGELLGQFGGPLVGNAIHDGDFHPTLPYLLVTTPPNEVRIHTLDIDELVAIAESGLSRDMTEDECQRYFRRPCDDS